MKNTFHIDTGKACILAGLVDERGIVLDYADVTNDAVNAVADFLIQGIEHTSRQVACFTEQRNTRHPCSLTVTAFNFYV